MDTKEEKLKQIRRYFDLTQIKFAEIIDCSLATVQKIEGGERKLGAQITQKILNKFPEINKEWFILNRGSMLLSTDISKQENIVNKPTETIKNYKNIISNEGKTYVDATGALGLYFDDMEMILNLMQKKQTTWKPIVQQLVKAG